MFIFEFVLALSALKTRPTGAVCCCSPEGEVIVVRAHECPADWTPRPLSECTEKT